MPINYAAVVNSRGLVVIQGSYRTGGVAYKKDVQQYAKSFQLFATKEIFLDDTLKLVYKNMDQLTVCIIATQSVDLQESGAFLEKFSNSITSGILGATTGDRGLHSSTDLERAAAPLNQPMAEQKYQNLSTDVCTFLASWNDNPANRSKVSTLFQ